jgi:hypothetical protein
MSIMMTNGVELAEAVKAPVSTAVELDNRLVDWASIATLQPTTHNPQPTTLRQIRFFMPYQGILCFAILS